MLFVVLQSRAAIFHPALPPRRCTTGVPQGPKLQLVAWADKVAKPLPLPPSAKGLRLMFACCRTKYSLGAQTLPWGLSDTAWVWTEQCMLETGVYTELGRRLSLLVGVVRAGHNPDSPGFGSGYLQELLCVRVLNQAEYFRGH